MIIGIPREIKDGEGRVGIVPAGVEELVRDGHQVLVEAGAGTGAGISDREFAGSGARMVASADIAWGADMVLKVKEPLPGEYGFLRPRQILFCFLHLAPLPALTGELIKRGVRAVAFETVQRADGSLPLLTPMSQVAGKMAAQVGAAYLQKERGGMGILLGGVPGTRHGRVLILGGGNAGLAAARVAYGMGAEVAVIDVDHARLCAIDELFGGRVVTLTGNRRNLREGAAACHVLIGAVLVPGARAPRLLDRETVRMMRPGSVLVDISIDQGGVAETSRPTSHSDPVYREEGVIHYCVPNMPGSVPATSTHALAAVTLPYARKLASADPAEVLRADPALARGVAVWDGALVCPPVAEAQHLACVPLREALTSRT